MAHCLRRLVLVKTKTARIQPMSQLHIILRVGLLITVLLFVPIVGAKLTLDIQTPVLLEGELPVAKITGLKPGQIVKVQALRNVRRRGEERTLYKSHAMFRSDSEGVVNLFSDIPVSASYSGADPSGLFWSMVKDEDAPILKVGNDRIVRFQIDANSDGQYDLEGDLRLTPGEVDTYEVSVGEQLPGSAFVRPTEGSVFPVIIAMGGSEGNDSGARDAARRWTARGYGVFVLPYYSPSWGKQPQQIPGLSKAFANIPVDYVKQAKEWLCARNDVQCHNIGLYGVSKGAELALLAGHYINDFAAIAAIVPSDVVWEGWGAGQRVSSFSWNGKALEYVPYLGMNEHFAKLQRGEHSLMRYPHEHGREANPQSVSGARIPVETIDEPVFVVGSYGDDVWPSGVMTDNIIKTRETAGKVTVSFVDRYANHYLSGDAYRPMPEANAKVRRVAFPALVEFFHDHLKSE